MHIYYLTVPYKPSSNFLSFAISIHSYPTRIKPAKMSLAPQLQAVLDNFNSAESFAPIRDTINTSRKKVADSLDPSQVIKPGTALPPFSLSNATSETVTSTSLITKGPLLIVFYRGEWCPFCNLTLRAFQQELPALTAKGVTLVAISPELPNTSLTTVEKNELQFQVLSDVDNKFARQLGLVNQQPEEMRPVFDGFGHGFKARYGNDSLQLPHPATILVDGTGVVRNVFVDGDYTKRQEPKEVLGWIDALEK
jgi:peroxiredoxin